MRGRGRTLWIKNLFAMVFILVDDHANARRRS